MLAQMSSITAKKHLVELVFDWDDTILASYHLSTKNYSPSTPLEEIDQETLDQLKILDKIAFDVLSKALAMGKVTIITNSETGWVAMSAEKFLPKTLELLPQLTIISARSTYEPIFPGKPKKWKYFAFIELLTRFVHPMHLMKSLVGFGDNVIDREALFDATASIPSIYSKSIKFVGHPLILNLVYQLQLIYSTIDYICTHEGRLDLQLSVSQSQPSAPLDDSAVDLTLNCSPNPFEKQQPEKQIEGEVSDLDTLVFPSSLMEKPDPGQKNTIPPGFAPLPGLHRPPTPFPGSFLYPQALKSLPIAVPVGNCKKQHLI